MGGNPSEAETMRKCEAGEVSRSQMIEKIESKFRLNWDMRERLEILMNTQNLQKTEILVDVVRPCSPRETVAYMP